MDFYKPEGVIASLRLINVITSETFRQRWIKHSSISLLQNPRLKTRQHRFHKIRKWTPSYVYSSFDLRSTESPLGTELQSLVLVLFSGFYESCFTVLWRRTSFLYWMYV